MTSSPTTTLSTTMTSSPTTTLSTTMTSSPTSTLSTTMTSTLSTTMTSSPTTTLSTTYSSSPTTTITTTHSSTSLPLNHFPPAIINEESAASIPTNGNNIPVTFLVSSLVVLAVVIALVVLFIKKRKSRKVKDNTYETPVSSYETNEDNIYEEIDENLIVLENSFYEV
jgi:hypothetical protein